MKSASCRRCGSCVPGSWWSVGRPFSVGGVADRIRDTEQYERQWSHQQQV